MMGFGHYFVHFFPLLASVQHNEGVFQVNKGKILFGFCNIVLWLQYSHDFHASHPSRCLVIAGDRVGKEQHSSKLWEQIIVDAILFTVSLLVNLALVTSRLYG